MNTAHNRALGAADTIARLLSESGTGYTAESAADDGPLFARVVIRTDDGAAFVVTVEGPLAPPSGVRGSLT